MPRNASGTYTLPAGNPVEAGTLIEASWANSTLEDIGNEITNSLSRDGEGGMLAPFRLADGTLGAPGIAWLNEPSTGFYRAGTGEMWGVVQGVQVLQYTANGVLIPTGRTFTAQGNASIGGTLSVTGATTLTGALAANGGVATTTLSTTGLATLDSASVTGNLSVGGTLVLTGGLTLNGNVTVGDSSADTLTINSTVTSDLKFTDNTYDIGKSGATRPRDLFLSRNASVAGTLGVTGAATLSSTLGVTGAITATGGVVGNVTGDVTGNVSGNAGTVTNGVYTTGSYANPAWITSLAGSKVSGDIAGNAATATALQTSRTIWGQSFNGTANVSGALTGVTDLTASGNGSFGGTLGVTGVTTLADNLTFSGSGKRITGDFSNATLTNRVMIQSSTTNGNTAVTVIPNGTATTGTFRAYNNSDPTNASFVQISAQSTSMRVESGISGSGTYRDLVFLAGASGTMTLDTSGNLSLASPGTFTLNSGTANGVLYLNGSKVATSGSALTFTSGKNLGIGTASPAASFHVNETDVSGTDITVSRFSTTSGGVVNLVCSDLSSSQPTWTWQTGTGENLAFKQGTSEQMRLTSTGLGIGTSSPSTNLEISTGATTNNPSIYLSNSGGYAGRVYAQGDLVLGTGSGATERLRVLSANGNVGIGTSSPSYKLDVSSSAEVVGRFARSAGSNALLLIQDPTTTTAPYIASYGNAMAFGRYGGGESMRLDSSGNLGLGVTPAAWALSGQKVLQVLNASLSAYTTDEATLSGNAYHYGSGWKYIASNYAEQYVMAGGAHKWYNAASGTAGNIISFTQAMTLDASGNLLVGATSAVTSAPAKIGILYAGASQFGIGIKTSDNSGSAIYFVNSSGTAVGNIALTSTNTAYNTSSDYRLKNTIAPMTGALAKVALLKPCTYKWNVDGSDGEGFIAHELAEVMPNAVTGDKDAVDAEGKPIYQGIDTSFLVATLTAALQEAVAEINSLKARLDAANL